MQNTEPKQTLIDVESHSMKSSVGQLFPPSPSASSLLLVFKDDWPLAVKHYTAPTWYGCGTAAGKTQTQTSAFTGFLLVSPLLVCSQGMNHYYVYTLQTAFVIAKKSQAV